MSDDPVSQPHTTLTVDDALRRAIGHYHAGQLPAAEQLYRAIIAAQPAHPAANLQLGLLALQCQQAGAALPYFKTALEAAPQLGHYWIAYIDALIAAGQFASARDVLEQGRLRGLAGAAVDALRDRLAAPAPGAQALASAAAHRDAGRYRDGAALLAAWLDANPGDAAANALLAQLLSLDHADDAAWAALRAAMAVAPHLALVQRVHARLLMKNKEMGAALDAARGAFQSDTADPENQLVLATALAANQQFALALPVVESALRTRPDYADALAIRAQCKLRSDDVAGALADAECCVAIKPHLSAIWELVGGLRLQCANLAGACAALEHALKHAPRNVAVMANLAELKRRAGDYDGAIALLEQAIAREPLHVGSWATLGAALQGARRIADAKFAYQRALELSPGQAEVANNLGSLANESQDWDAALRYFTHAVASKPSLVEAHCNLGVSLQRVKRFEEAASSLRTALRLRPDYATAHNNLGAVLKDQGELQEALACYRRALDLQAGFDEARLNLAHTLGDLDAPAQAALAYQQVADGAAAPSAHEAAVNLAILHYLQGDFVRCRDRLSRSETVFAQPTAQNRFARTYWTYLSRLLTWHGANASGASRDGLEVMHIIGESHCLGGHGMPVRFQGRKWRCNAEWISGCKQWHLGNTMPNRFKHKFATIMERLPRASHVLLCIGEIDCRADDGIIRAWLKQPARSIETLMGLAQATISAYCAHVAMLAARHGHTLIIGGVPCTNVAPDALSGISEERYIGFIQDFNALLCSEVHALKLHFLDVHGLTDCGGGRTDGSWHIDEHHLLPSAIGLAFDNYCCAP